MHDTIEPQGIADITRELLTVELDKLAVDHYSDDRNAACNGCRRAAIIASTLAGVIAVTRG